MMLKKFILLASRGLILILCFGGMTFAESLYSYTFKRPNAKLYIVTSIIDGDTIEILYQGERKQVRFLGVDTPEVTTDHTQEQCYAYEAALFTFQALRRRQVALDIDPVNDQVDQYDRLLRYVDIPQGNGNFLRLNEMLVRGGFGKVTRSYPLSQKEKYLTMENQSRRNNQGLWKTCETKTLISPQK